MSAISILQAQAAGFGTARIALLVADLVRRFAKLQSGIRFGHGRSARRARFDAALATADPAIASAVAERNGQTLYAPDLPRIKRYETLIYDCMIGDATLFQHADMVEAGWRIVQLLQETWAAEKPFDFPNYRAGSAGPAAADKLLADDDGRAWRPINDHS